MLGHGGAYRLRREVLGVHALDIFLAVHRLHEPVGAVRSALRVPVIMNGLCLRCRALAIVLGLLPAALSTLQHKS